MSRTRTIKPEFWVSTKAVECTPLARLLFIGMWNFCDDSGIHPASARLLKMKVLPGDDISAHQVSELVDELIKNGLVMLYEVNSKHYWKVVDWEHQQKIDKPSYKYPLPDGSLLRTGCKNRLRIFERDGYTCQYCGAHGDDVKLECDHVIPVSRGGSNDDDNLKTACRNCNRSKGDRLIDEWMGVQS